MKCNDNILNTLRDIGADTSRKRISIDEFTVCCQNLAEKVRVDYDPDIVVAIATGGSMTGELIAKLLKVPIAHITIRRNIVIGRMYNFDIAPLRWLFSFYHHYLFRTTAPTVSTEIKISIIGKKILIIDDTIHTGATIDAALHYLRNKGGVDIKIASLAYVAKRKPDFSVLSIGNYCFPWSKDF
jgi:hypoxanthine phosphoribosyltransferase